MEQGVCVCVCVCVKEGEGTSPWLCESHRLRDFIFRNCDFIIYNVISVILFIILKYYNNINII